MKEDGLDTRVPDWVVWEHGGLVAEFGGNTLDAAIGGGFFLALAAAWWVATALAWITTGPEAAFCMSPLGIGLLWLVRVLSWEGGRRNRVRLDPSGVTLEVARFGRTAQSWRVPLRELHVSTRTVLNNAEAHVVGMVVERPDERIYLPPGTADADGMAWLVGVLQEAANEARAQPPDVPDREALGRIEALLLQRAQVR